jgi:hypothetical protein
VVVTPTEGRRFIPLSLDAVNFLLADVRGALGPYLNVFLVTRQHWSLSENRPPPGRRPESSEVDCSRDRVSAAAQPAHRGGLFQVSDECYWGGVGLGKGGNARGELGRLRPSAPSASFAR